MTPIWRNTTLTAVLLMGLASGAAGQQPEPIPPTRRQVRDPTEPSPKLKEAMTVRQPGAVAEATVVLRARVLAKGQTPVATLEINGRTQTVAKGGTLAGTGYVVTEINALEIRIENSLTKETIVLR